MSQFARLLDETGLTDVCTELSCGKEGKIDKFLFRSAGGVTVEPVSWSEETETFQTEDGLSLSDHEPVATRFTWSTE